MRTDSENSVTDTLDAEGACRLLSEAAALLRDDPIRRGSLLTFGSAGQVVMTGDMHGNVRNFEKLQRYCQLERSPGRYVVLHELIHREVYNGDETDDSIDLLLRAAQWKCDFPDNVFFLQSNHELAQLRGQEITKGGRSVLHDFAAGVEMRFGDGRDRVLAAVNEYIAALPLAARTANGIFMCHSLPDPMLLPGFDIGIFDRVPTDQELSPGGAAYALVWGRFQTPGEIDAFAQRLGVEHFIVGHTPQEFGYARIGRMIILASDHSHGAFLPIDLARRYTGDELEAAIRKFAGVE
ncbi:MAG: hypothetical protein D6744_04795 [Planctomycetota bacterium]|nr:MAG: hypothetical protein D6744_04795 [Planctomycetota bacterium]